MFEKIFHFFKKKKVNTEKVTEFKEAIKAINIFILLSEWEKAKKSIKEIEEKEQEALTNFLDKYRKDDSENTKKAKNKLIEENRKRFKELQTLKEFLYKKEEIYNQKSGKERLKIRFNKTQSEIKQLIGSQKLSEALHFLQNFLEEYKTEPKVISFYNKQKKIIIKNIEKQKKKDEEKIKKNTKVEALKLIGKTIKLDKNEEDEEKEKNLSIWKKVISKLNFYKDLKENIRKKRLLDEINLLIEEDSKVKNDMAAKKLANIHKGLIKEISNQKMNGYELYGKILGADKISGDTFGIYDNEEGKYNFFLGDATGHGIKAGFIITLLSRLFHKYVKNSSLQTLVFEINNGLKQDLQSRNFITGIFFEMEQETKNTIKFVGMGHEPMLIYRNKEKKVEKIIPGGLAAGIRMMKDKSQIKPKEIILEHNDILMVYSDGIVENRNHNGDLYGIDRLQNIFNKIATFDKDVNRIYEYIISDVQVFRGGSDFLDDASILILKRNEDKDILGANDEYIKDLSIKEGLRKNEVKKLDGKSKSEINVELEKIKKVREIKRILKILENLYYTGEILKLKQEAIRFIKAGFIHKKINYFLKKAIDNEKKYKIEQKNIKLVHKYDILKELLKKGDYTTVIHEIEEIITKDGNL